MADKTPLPFPETVLTDADRKKMDDIRKSVQRAQLIGGNISSSLNLNDLIDILLCAEFSEMKRMEPIYESRRRFTTTIPKFWPSAFLRHEGLAMDLNNPEDIKALLNLTDVAIQRNPLEPRVFTLEFVRIFGGYLTRTSFHSRFQTFSKNPYFDDRVLKKVYQFTESQARKKEPVDREGFKWTMLDFDWDRDVKGSVSQLVRTAPVY